MNRKIMSLFLLSLIAVSMLGVAYATWWDYVQIEATVNMGELLFGILDIKDITDNEWKLPVPKDVAWCDVELEVPETGVHHLPAETVWHEMYIKVHNAYPSYEQVIVFNLKNAGTIPVHIVSLLISDPTGELIFDDGAVLDDGEGVFMKDVDGDGVLDPIINICINKAAFNPVTGQWECVAPLLCNQIDPCTAEVCALFIHFKEPAEECHEYFFKIFIDAVQWNKA